MSLNIMTFTVNVMNIMTFIVNVKHTTLTILCVCGDIEIMLAVS